MDLDKVYRVSERIASRKIVDEVILVPLRDKVAEMESLYSLNAVGARVYELIDGKRAVRDIVAAIVEEFEVDSRQAESDVTQFVEQLLSINGIEECPKS
ncbi:MAG TPA: PqqD family protein [Vicinamibacteria bacterium]|nr:PqqD family protein [Vicinamibacteria bacterium]